MFEKVNPCHPDKVADRIAGALVDIAYETQVDPKVAVEVLIGHGICHIIAETSAQLNKRKVMDAVHRIAGNLAVDYVEVPQDGHLANNQVDGIRCGDNGIFKAFLSRQSRSSFPASPEASMRSSPMMGNTS